MKKIIKWLVLAVVIVIAGLFILRATAPDPKFNPASFEASPLDMQALPVSEGRTLAQMREASGNVKTFMVVGFDKDSITGVDLQNLGAIESANPFAVLASMNDSQLKAAAINTASHVTVDFSKLISVAGDGEHHLGTATNFPEHADEADSDSVFNFPKFGSATPARTVLPWIEGGLLDYEVELCARFDRSVRSSADFDAATKGFFLCGDFTERATMVRLANPDNLNSGKGFSDSKSGPGFFPTGALLVIPNDWETFIAKERMTASLNSEPRQDARGGEMIHSFRELTDIVLADSTKPRFLYKDDYFKLVPNEQIEDSMILMSGTSEGVIFTIPTRADFINGLFAYIKNGAVFSSESLLSAFIESFIQSEYESQHFLQPGDRVEFASSSMGNIVVQVEE